MTPTKTLHLITRLIVGGAQESTILTAEMLDKAQWTVHILSGPQTGAEGSLIEHTRALGIPLFIEPTLVRELNPLKDALAFFRLVRFIKRGGYTIVHTHSSKAGILGRWAAWLAGVPVIVHTVHGWAHHDYQRPLVRWMYITLEKITLPITNRLTTDSVLNITKGLQDGIGRPENYVDTPIRCGIELERFGHPQVSPAETRAAWGIPAKATVVGTVTRFSAQKAPLDFIRAAGLIAPQFSNVYFMMGGDGPLLAAAQELIAEQGLTGRFILTGLRRDVPELLAAMDLFVLSSLWEGLPRVLPQAMATGLPVVATAVDGNSEIVREGINGRLTPPGNPPALAQAVIELLSNPRLMAQMGQAGQQFAPEFGPRQWCRKPPGYTGS
jgi:glycosyltransferase involved in cell wall biosynthesis